MEKVFRNKIAQKYFEHFKSNSWVCECGIDSHGFIYVAWLNGKTDRYNRSCFIKEAKEFYSSETEEWSKH